MRFLLVGAAFAVIIPRLVVAQQCAVADSVFGGAATTSKLDVKYDPMTDTMRVATKTDKRVRAQMRILARAEGKQITSSAGLVFEYEEMLMAPDTRQSFTAANARYSASSPLLLLADGTDRIPLTEAHHSASISPAFGPLPATMTETLRYPITLEQLARIGKANEVKLRMGDFEVKLAGKVREGARALYASVVCTTP
jgi:hypothetical protein